MTSVTAIQSNFGGVEVTRILASMLLVEILFHMDRHRKTGQYSEREGQREL